MSYIKAYQAFFEIKLKWIKEEPKKTHFIKWLRWKLREPNLDDLFEKLCKEE